MKIVVFGLAISSSWGNGHATLWRGLCAALARRGHSIVFLEHDVAWYSAHRDYHAIPNGELIIYSSWSDVGRAAAMQLGNADAAIVTSYCPDALEATQLVTASKVGVTCFYDLDTPVTLQRLKAGEVVSYIGPNGLREFDLVLSFTGGAGLQELRDRLGAREVAPLYGSVDPAAHCPIGRPPDRAALSYLGTYARDRQETLEQLFLEPARRLSRRRFSLGGSQYPADLVWPANVSNASHVPPPEHSAFYCASELTLNITRGPMATTGFCPSGRLFEAAACRVPVISDWWTGLDTFFEPGTEILVARTTEDVMEGLARSVADLERIGIAAHRRVLAEHTADQRADQLLALLRKGA